MPLHVSSTRFRALSWLITKITHRVLVRKFKGKRLLGRPRCVWKDNIKTRLKETGRPDMDWLNLAEERNKCHVVNTGSTKLLNDELFAFKEGPCSME